MTASHITLRQVQLGLALLVEAGWLFAWSAVLGAWSEPREPVLLLGLPGILVLLAAAVLATRLALGQRAHSGPARVTVALLGLVVALLAAATVLLPAGWPAAPPELRVLVGSATGAWHALAAATLVLLAWWRGIVAGRSRPSVDAAEASLRLAVGALALLFLIQVFAPRDERSVGPLAGAALMVLAAGLLATPLAALLDQGDSSRLEGASAPRIGAHWLGLLIGAVAVILLLATLLAQAVTFERLDLILQPLGIVLGAVYWALVYGLGILGGFVVELLIWLLRRLANLLDRDPPMPPPDLRALDALREQGNRPLPTDSPLFAIFGVVAGAALVALMGWLLVRAVVRWAEPLSGDEVPEVRELIWSRDGLRSGLRRWLRSLRAREHQPGSAEQPRLPAEGAPRSTDPDPRELYRALLRFGARLGRRRAAHETPHEYERALAALGPLSTGRAHVSRLTDVYAQARYSAAMPSPHEVAEARSALERLEALAGATADTPDTPDPRHAS